MAKCLQLRRGVEQAQNLFTGEQGEVTMTTDTNELRVHNGTKVGGFRVPTLVAVQYPSAANEYTWYRKYSDGWVEQGGVYDRGAYSASWNTTITLPVTMADTGYTAIVSVHAVDGDHLGEHGLNTEDRTTTGFSVYYYTGASQDGARAVAWIVKGLAA